ncbi:hypothetical protein [Nocardia nova]|uniref:hypothetical protein n=1 Tax=Nocardia nova TaxID=37330 RepID=UPI00340B7EF7
MTEPDPAASIEQWQAKLLARIEQLARTYTHVHARGFANYDGLDGSAEDEWRSHLDALESERETTQTLAIELGVPERWVDQARAKGMADPPQLPDPVPAEPVPAEPVPAEPVPAESVSAPSGLGGAVSASRRFLVDMAAVDVWHVHRMALLSAARDIRRTDQYASFGVDPVATMRFERNLEVHYLRAAGLSDAAQLSATEVENLWDSPQVDAARRQAAELISRWDDLQLEFEWRRYTKPDPAPVRPPYIPVDPDTGAPVTRAQAPPPALEQLVSRAAAALGADPERTDRFPISHTHAIDAALPATASRSWEPAPGTGPDDLHRPPPDLGTDP